MKHLIIVLCLFCVLCKSAADNEPKKRDSPYRLNILGGVDSPRKRSKSVVESIVIDQLRLECESSPRSKDIFKIWNSNPQDPVPGVSATLCKVVRSKSVPHVELELTQDTSSLTQEQTGVSARP